MSSRSDAKPCLKIIVLVVYDIIVVNGGDGMRQIEGQLDLFSDIVPEDSERDLYGAACKEAEERGALHIGTVMRLFRIPATKAQELLHEMQERGVLDSRCRFEEKKVKI